MNKIQFLEVKSEIGAGTRGASLGIDAIKSAALTRGDVFFRGKETQSIQTENQLLNEGITTPNAKRISGLVKIFERITDSVSGILKQDKFPFVLAGDHSTAGGTIAGIKKAYPNKRLGVVWIDAHADLHSPHTSPSGNLHGMPLAISLAEDNLEKKRNTIVDETKLGWEKLKNMGGPGAKILPQDLIFVALRDTEMEEDFLIQKHNIRVVKVEEVRALGAESIAPVILKALEETDIIYISLDVDSLDSKISVGTGTPVANGLEIIELKEIVQGLLNSPKTICFELVEVNPLLDLKGNSMAEIAFDIIKDVYSTVAEKK
jgi:arginase